MSSEFLSIQDLQDLPAELIAQLNLSDSDRKNMAIVEIVKSRQPVGLDAIHVDLYRQHGWIEERQKLMARMYRLTQKGLIKSVDGRKGIYEIPPKVVLE